MREAEQLGSMLALFVTHGKTNVQEAMAALRQGKATPQQQRIAFQLIEAITR